MNLVKTRKKNKNVYFNKIRVCNSKYNSRIKKKEKV